MSNTLYLAHKLAMQPHCFLVKHHLPKSTEKSVWFKIVHFFFLFPLTLFVEMEESSFWLCSLIHSLCSCCNSSLVSSPSCTSFEPRDESVAMSSSLWFWTFDTRPLLTGGGCEAESLEEVAGAVEDVWFSVARISRVMLRTPIWIVVSSSFWISRMWLASGNMSMKR